MQSHYPTRADAKAARLFDRGWLPAIIPPSSRNIKVENDLDLNTSAGEFYFEKNDLASFLSNLHKLTVADLSDTDQSRLVEQGYAAYRHSDGRSDWLFFIDLVKGHCIYQMQSKQS